MNNNILRSLSILCLFPCLAQADQCSQLTMLEMAQSLKSGKISSADCIKQLAIQSDALENYHIFITSDFNKALLAAKKSNPRSPYSGIPIAVKDNIDVKGFATTAGTPAFQYNYPKQSAAIIKKLEKLGFIVVGKTNMHELAAGVTSNNYHYGPVRNPYDCRKFAGGSSGGSATAVAFGIVPIAIGTDTAGSIRIPASLSGVVGFRPTVGRYSTEGVVPASSTFDTIGFLSRSVADIIAVDQNTVSPKLNYSSIRLGVPRAYFYKNLDPETKLITEQFLQKLKAKGVELIYEDIPDLENLINQTAFPIALYEFKLNLQQYIQHRLPKLTFIKMVSLISSPDVKSAFTALLKKPVTKTDYLRAKNIARPKLQKEISYYFKKNKLDAIIFPTTFAPAGDINNEKLDDEVEIYAHNTMPAANAGLPGLTIPIGFTKNHLPIGIEVDGMENQDNHLLAVGVLLQNLAGVPSIVKK